MNKLYSFINLMGLTLGLAVAITLFWIVRFEYSFDNYHSKLDGIYRVFSTDRFGVKQSHVAQGVIKALNTQIPGVEMAANLQAVSSASIKVGTEILPRTKEIGVRKVLGATVSSIITLLSKDFLVMVSVAFVIASPLAWYIMKAFLSDYTYKIDIEIWVFAISGILTIGVAFLTISFQSIRAALMNPVKSLKSE